jgi:hypothetical protein
MQDDEQKWARPIAVALFPKCSNADRVRAAASLDYRYFEW